MYSTSAVSGRHGWVKIVLLGGMGMEWELTGVKWGRLADRDRDRDMDSDMTDGRDRGGLGRGKGGQGQGQG